VTPTAAGCKSKGGDNREQRAHIRQAARDGEGAGEAGVSTGAQRQIGTATRTRRSPTCTPRRARHIDLHEPTFLVRLTSGRDARE
jgi:hypothetical protein